MAEFSETTNRVHDKRVYGGLAAHARRSEEAGRQHGKKRSMSNIPLFSYGHCSCRVLVVQKLIRQAEYSSANYENIL